MVKYQLVSLVRSFFINLSTGDVNLKFVCVALCSLVITFPLFIGAIFLTLAVALTYTVLGNNSVTYVTLVCNKK